MNYSFSITKHLVLVPILVVVTTTQLLLIRNVSSLDTNNAYVYHRCLTRYGEFEPGSKYKKHRDKVIHMFLHGDTEEGFRDGYASGGNEDGFVTFQCRGDSYGSKCRSCFSTAQYELAKRCPRDKAAIIFYDQCLVEFSPVNKYGLINYHEGLCIPSAKSSSNDYLFPMLKLVHNLTDVATNEKKNDLYAAGEKQFPEDKLQKKKIYVMVQCIRLVPVKDCYACLVYLARHFHCYKDKQGARMFMGKTCRIRFELSPFVKTSPNYYKF